MSEQSKESRELAAVRVTLPPTKTWAADEVPAEWMPADCIDLVKDDEAHLVWIALIPDGPRVPRAALEANWPYKPHVRVDVDRALERLQRYGLLNVVVGGGADLTPKGFEWAEYSAVGAYDAGFIPESAVPEYLRGACGLPPLGEVGA